MSRQDTIAEVIAALLAKHLTDNIEVAEAIHEGRPPDVTDLTRHVAEDIDTITTVDELDALPIGTVIRDEGGMLFLRNEVRWVSPGWGYESDNAKLLPATVLYRPKETP